ncbi:glycosyltransferase involved in cell wall biosynthesis [Microbacterium sp. AK009]|uniref:glycosyltransferase family 2 protein n=1 Tax=Microbacterium sp. AK009 TaxID=2723068 RepID=UPI0015C9FC8C|nr:hypothetical protein [Microbacterium sp. AK009]NYF15850.1 glycosyltransferase involved in cell wall biosynthesis [Microbacterium sp. AK009]
MLRELASPRRFELLAGEVRPDSILVVICLYNRPDRIDAVLAQLAAQRGSPSIRLVMWNNAPRDDGHYRARIRAMGAWDALASVEYRSSPNIGGIARFIVARRLLGGRAGVPFVMIDDDQDFDESFVAQLLSRHAPRSFSGVWAFFILGSYWARIEAEADGGASYVGTGGSVCDAALVRTRGFFWRLPGRYGFIEDLWASMFAGSRGWDLTRAAVPVRFVGEEMNQYHKLTNLKPEFYDYLIAQTRLGMPL